MIDRGSEPIPGENRLSVVFFSVVFGLALAGLLAALIASIWVPDLGTTIIVVAWLTGFAGVALIVSILFRRAYLRKVRNGQVIERRPWSPDITPPL